MSIKHDKIKTLSVPETCCLSTQGYLIANHLPKEDLLDVCLYCQHYCLLCLGAEQRVGQLVVWREVFLQRRSHSHTASSTSRPGYRESQGRVFLLVVGLVRVKYYFNHHHVITTI